MDALLAGTRGYENFNAAKLAVSQKRTPSSVDVTTIFYELACKLAPKRVSKAKSLGLVHSDQMLLPGLGEPETLGVTFPVAVFALIKPISDRWGLDLSLQDLAYPDVGRFAYQLETIESFLEYRSQLRAGLSDFYSTQRHIKAEEISLSAAEANLDREWAAAGQIEQEEAIEELEFQVTELRDSILDIKSKLEERQSKLSRMESELPEKQRELSVLEAEIKLLRPVIASGPGTVRDEMSVLRTEVETLENDNAQYLQRAMRAEVMEQHLDDIEKALYELDGVSQDISEHISVETQLNDVIRRLEIDADDLKGRLLEAQSRIGDLDNELVTIKAELSTLEQQEKTAKSQAESNMLSLTGREKSAAALVEKIETETDQVLAEISEVELRNRQKRIFIEGTLTTQLQAAAELSSKLRKARIQLQEITSL